MSEAHSADIHDERPRLLQVAGIMFVTEDGYTLVSKRPAGKRYPHAWQIPGGKCEPHESPQQGALRELLEETGIVIQIENLGSPYTQVTIEEHGQEPYEAFVFRVKLPPLEASPLRAKNKEQDVIWSWRQLGDMISKMRSSSPEDRVFIPGNTQHTNLAQRVIIPGMVEALTKADQEWNEEETARWKARGEFEKWSWYQHTFYHKGMWYADSIDYVLFQKAQQSHSMAPNEHTNIQVPGTMRRPFVGTGLTFILDPGRSDQDKDDCLEYIASVHVGERVALTMPLELFRFQDGPRIRFDFDLGKDLPGAIPYQRLIGFSNRPQRNKYLDELMGYWPLVFHEQTNFRVVLRTQGLCSGMKVSAYLHGYEAREWV